jgi:hypothetical protein
MQPYLTRDSSVDAIRNINQLFCDIKKLYFSHGIDITNDVGRQNILISAAQEHFFASAINKSFGKASNDGRTGAADIIISSV